MKTRTKAAAPFGGSVEEWAEPLCDLHRHTYNVLQCDPIPEVLHKGDVETKLSHNSELGLWQVFQDLQITVSSPEDIQWGRLREFRLQLEIQETNASQKNNAHIAP